MVNIFTAVNLTLLPPQKYRRISEMAFYRRKHKMLRKMLNTESSLRLLLHSAYNRYKMVTRISDDKIAVRIK